MADRPEPPPPERMRTWVGRRLDDLDGAGVGRIEGLYVDSPGGEPAWLLARMGRFGHYTLLPPRDAVEGVERLWVPYTRDQIRRAPRIEPGAALTAALERELIAHYEISDAERLGRLADLDGAEVTARPADDS